MHAPQNLRDRRALLQLPRLSGQPTSRLRNLKKKSHAPDGCRNRTSASVKKAGWHRDSAALSRSLRDSLPLLSIQ
jgi:hypothetical protein